MFLEKVNYFLVSSRDRGLTRQRNFGIERVANESEIVCFLDDDLLNNTNMKKITLAIVLLLVIVAGCRKEDVFTSELLDTQMSEREIFKYSKTIEVFDKERKNSIVLKISTNSKERLQQKL